MRSKQAVIYYCGFLSRVGGAFNHAKTLKMALQDKGWEVEIVTLDNLFVLWRYLPHLVERITNFVYAPYGFLFKERLTRWLFKTFHKRKSALLVFEDIFISWPTNCPTVTLLHATWSDNLQAYDVKKDRLQSFIEKEVELINKIDHPVITVSEEYQEYLTKNHFNGLIHKQIHVIPLALDQTRFKKVNRNPHHNSFIYVGGLEARKNLDFLLRVFKELSDRGHKHYLTIVGDGPDRQKLESFSKAHSLNVKFLGRLSYDEVIPILASHQFYVHTSLKESFSYSLLEAKLAGLTTIAYGKLEVPMAFIDIPVDNFEVSEWVSKLQNITPNSEAFDGSLYELNRMADQTIKLANT